jgi:hypothetical protein
MRLRIREFRTQPLSIFPTHNYAMNVLLIQSMGSTSIRRCLPPRPAGEPFFFTVLDRLTYGIRVRTASLGGALALVSELRWYIQRTSGCPF